MTDPFPVVPLSRVVHHRKAFIEVEDTQHYKRCRVQLHAGGILLRDIVAGIEIKTKRQQVCRPGEFLVAEIDAKHGGFGIVPDGLAGAIVSSHYFLFTVDEDALDRHFLGYYIRTPAFRDQVAAQGTTNYAAIRPQHVLDYTIPLPPLAEQRRIVARIEALAARIEEARGVRREAVEETEALAKSVLRHTFNCNNGSKPELLENVCLTIIDNLHSNPIYSTDGVPCARSPDVEWGRLRLETALRTSEDEYQRRTMRGEPQADDIVLVREGGGTGKAAIVEEGQRFSLGQRVMMLRPDRHRIIPRFFLHQLLSPSVYDNQIVPLTKGSASPHLNIAALRGFSIFLPPLPEQRRMVAYLDEVQGKVEALKRLQAETTAELEALLPAVLDRAFRGEL